MRNRMDKRGLVIMTVLALGSGASAMIFNALVLCMIAVYGRVCCVEPNLAILFVEIGLSVAWLVIIAITLLLWFRRLWRVDE